MKIAGKHRLVFALTAASAAVLAFAVPGFLAANAASCGGPRISYSYPIVLKGSAELTGIHVGSFSASALRNGVWTEVAVQIEEVNTSGDYVLEGGIPYTRGTDDGLFDSNDELAVMGDDLGDDFALADVPKGLRDRAVHSWKVGFCRGNKLVGHLLLQSRFAPQRISAPDYVRFDRDSGTISSDIYQYRFHEKNPVLLGEVALKKEGKSNPVIESSHFVMPLRTPFFMPNLMFEDQDFTSTIESWQSGPVRTIIAVGVKYTSFLSLFKLHLFSELVFYKNRFVIPTKIEFVFSPRKFLNPGSGVAYALKLPADQNWRFESNLAPLPGFSPDRYFKEGPRASTQDEFYAMAHGRDGSLIARVSVDEKARAMVPMPIMLKSEDFKAKANQDSWPWLARQNGDLGIFIDFSNVEKGMYNFGLDLLLSSKADERFTDYGFVEAVWHRLPSSDSD